MGYQASIIRVLGLGMSLFVTTLTVQTSFTPARAEQLIALGQEKATTQSTDSRTGVRTPLTTKDSQTTIRKSHKLIRKSSPSGTALIQAPTTATDSGSVTSGTTASGATLQTKDSTTTVNPTTSTAVAPAKPSSTTTSSFSVTGAISSGTSAPSTTSSPLAGVAAPGGNGNGNGNAGTNAKGGGRGMQ